MPEAGERIATLVGAVIAFVLQIVVAPNITLFFAQPNFLLVYVVVVALARAQSCGVVLPFVLGLLSDLVGGGPVGASALLFVIASFAVSRLYFALNNDTLFIPLFLVVVSVLLVEVFYGVLLIACGLAVNPLEALVYRALPCALYDCVFSLIIYPLAMRFLAPRQPQQPGAPLMG